MRFYLNNSDAGYPEYATAREAADASATIGGEVLLMPGQLPITDEERAILDGTAL